MPILNIIEVGTPHGSRSFELHQDDITQLDDRVDLMVISAFERNYSPTPGTVIGALQDQLRISVDALSKDPEFDFRDQLGCWISKEIGNERVDRIACVEGFATKFTPEESIQNLFAFLSLLDAKDIPIETVAMPVLGAGNQQQPAIEIIAVMLDESKKALTRLRSLKRVIFVAYSADRAEHLDEAMNDVLGRVRVVLPRGELVDALRSDINKTLSSIEHSTDSNGRLIDDLRRIISDKDSRSFEIGIVGRRLAESIVNDIRESTRSQNLNRSIEDLGKQDIAIWIRLYLHVLRVLGNESAHEQSTATRFPSNVCEDDMVLFLACVQRVLDFWVEHRSRT